MSLSGQPTPGLTVVAGAAFIKARVSGSSVDRGLIGPVPPGLPPSVFKLSLQYGPSSSWHGLSVDAQLDTAGGHYANRANTFRVLSAATMDVGMRYAFTFSDVKANLRVQLRNIMDGYA